MVSGLVAYGSGAQEMGEKRRRKAFSGIRRKPKLRRKSVKVERTITRKATHGNARMRSQIPLGHLLAAILLRQCLIADEMRRSRFSLCAFYKIFARIFVRSAY